MNVSTSYRPSAWPRASGRGTLACALALVLLGATLSANAREPLPVPGHAVIGVEDHHLQADYWIGRLAQPQHALLDAAGVAAQNARMRQQDRHVHDLETLPATLTRADVEAPSFSLTLPKCPSPGAQRIEPLVIADSSRFSPERGYAPAV